MSVIDKEILIYHNIPYKKYRWIAYISVFQVGFLGLNILFLPTENLVLRRKRAQEVAKQKNKLPHEIENDSEVISWTPTEKDYSTVLSTLFNLDKKELFSLKNVKENISDRPLLSSFMIGAAILTTLGLNIYTRRNVHKITLLPNDRVRITVFKPTAIGKPLEMEMPLSHVSCVSPRKSSHNYSILKLKGYRAYHLVHKSEGQFLEPKLYDHFLGYERSWATK